ncbi:hypothetical protein M426DRAFT_115877 [Hypoxylon sp. CI-4A]|nr:hypothetical protein M426DRAFT_115877 [Hypoxylon sp. CI-4A]
MATDSLHALINNIPDWLKRLEELNGQIEQRQQDLANLPENRPKSSGRSIRNKGSTESLRPRDETTADQPPDIVDSLVPPPLAPVDTQPQDGAENPACLPGEIKLNGGSIRRQEVVATAQRRARAVVRKRQKTDSMVSNENTVPKYRSRHMIIVYYDSYVQSFFEELVKFVSMQRNSMRKAKMAAKVARIKRLAELEMPDEEDDEEDGNELKPRDSLVAADGKPRLPGAEETKLRFMSTRQMGLRNLGASRAGMRMPRYGLNGGLGSFQDKGDIWEELDKDLEFVQGMCEHGAHQFLRDGDCSDEVEKIKTRLARTKESADKELTRVQSETPDDMDSSDVLKSRSFRPMTMRREIEDEGVQDMGDDFRPIYKSSR